MHHRDLVALMAAIAVVSLAPLLATGQAAAQTASASAWTAPRTADGQPDLQDVWLSNSATPLERPPALVRGASV